MGPVRTVISPRRNPLMSEVKPGRLGTTAGNEMTINVIMNDESTCVVKMMLLNFGSTDMHSTYCLGIFLD